MRGVSLLLATCGVVAAILAWRLVAELIPADAASSSMSVRLGMAALALLPGAMVLTGMILAQMCARFAAGAFDPLGGRETRFLLVNQRVITNSVEQMVAFAPAMLALAAGASGGQMAYVLALGPVFAGARVAFWAGYVMAPIARAPGMAASFVVNVAALGAAVWFWLA